MTLQEIGLKFGTDKSRHTTHNKTYLDIYDKYFSKIRYDVKTMCEIGTLNGESAKTWEEYFPNATIHMVDIDPGCKRFETDRIKVHIGSQNDDIFLNKLAEKIGNFDILIDDGSHMVNHQIKTFNTLFPNLNLGGYYIIEDLGCSYGEIVNHLNVRNLWPGMSYNDPTDPLLNNREDFNNFILSLIKQLDRQQTEKLFSIHFYPMIAIFENKEKS